MSNSYLKKWVVQQMFAIEAGELDDHKRELFLSFMSLNAGSQFLQECFKIFEKKKQVTSSDDESDD
jgi:hypothetical protein